MLLLKIIHNLFSVRKVTAWNSVKYLTQIFNIISFIKKENFSFFIRWSLLFILMNLHNIKSKTNYFLLFIYLDFFNNQKLISYVLNITLSSTNTFVNVNSIKGIPKNFYSAGMFQLQKNQKIRQPKAMLTILRYLLLKLKIIKIKPMALHFNNFFYNQQSYIFKKLKQKIFTRLITNCNFQSHNGCRLRKKKRIKIRTQAR